MLIIIPVHENMQGVVSYHDKTSIPFSIRRGVKQVSLLFAIFFSILFIFAFRQSEEISCTKEAL